MLAAEYNKTNEHKLTVHPSPTATRINFALNSINNLSTLNEVTISKTMRAATHLKKRFGSY